METSDAQIPLQLFCVFIWERLAILSTTFKSKPNHCSVVHCVLSTSTLQHRTAAYSTVQHSKTVKSNLANVWASTHRWFFNGIFILSSYTCKFHFLMQQRILLKCLAHFFSTLDSLHSHFRLLFIHLSLFTSVLHKPNGKHHHLILFSIKMCSPHYYQMW